MTEKDQVAQARKILADYRASIDNIDAALIHMLAERFRCTKAVGVLKATHGLPPADPSREADQIARLRKLADDAHLDPDFAEKFLNFVVREVIRHHEQSAASGNGGDKNAASNGVTETG
jgi:chorismate mutase